MKRHLLLFITGVMAAVLAPPVVTAADDSLTADIKALEERQAQAWNAHDAKAYADLFVADGDLVNVQGWWWKGRAEIERKLRQAYAVTFSASRLTITDVAVRSLGRDLALAHVRWVMDGAKAPPGAMAPPRQGVQLQVLRRDAGRWQIVSFQNTNSLPEMDFPVRKSPNKPMPE